MGTETGTLVSCRYSQQTLSSDAQIILMPARLNYFHTRFYPQHLWSSVFASHEKPFQLRWLTFWKPHTLLQAKSCIQVHAESSTEINGKHAAASMGGPHLPSFPSVLPPLSFKHFEDCCNCFWAKQTLFQWLFVPGSFHLTAEFLVLGPQINFSSMNVYNIHKWVEWRHWNRISASANEAGIGSGEKNEGRWNVIQEEGLSKSAKRHLINLNEEKY